MVHGAEITFPTINGREARGYLALPEMEDAIRRPAVLVFQELYGLNDDIRAIARRFAASGYVAFAPDLFAWGGPRPICVARTMRQLGKGEGPVFDHIDHARAYLAARDDVDDARVGVAGFCMGGGFAILYAAQQKVRVAAPFYGAVPGEREALAGICPVFAGYGERDAQTTKQGRRLDAFLTELDVPHQVRFYGDAGHSYMNQGGPGWLKRLFNLTPFKTGYHEPSAEDSWAGMLAFFERHLRAA